MECYCNIMNACNWSCTDSVGVRSRQHETSDYHFNRDKALAEVIQSLLASGQVSSITIDWDFQHKCYHLTFKTFPGSCASQLCYYLCCLER
jgi:hypothetical protein